MLMTYGLGLCMSCQTRVAGGNEWCYLTIESIISIYRFNDRNGRHFHHARTDGEKKDMEMYNMIIKKNIQTGKWENEIMELEYIYNITNIWFLWNLVILL